MAHSLKEIVEGFARKLDKLKPITALNLKAYTALYNLLEPQLNDALKERLTELQSEEKAENVEIAKETIKIVTKFKKQYKPAPVSL